MPGTGSAGVRGRLDIDDRRQRRIGGARYRRAATYDDAVAPVTDTARNRCGPRHARRPQSDGVSLAGVHGAADPRVDGDRSVRPPESRAIVGRRALLRLGNDHYRRLRRFQFCLSIHFLAPVRGCADVRRRDRHGGTHRVSGGPAAVAAFCQHHRAAARPPHARPHRRGRPRFDRRARRHRSDSRGLRRAGCRAEREQPLPANGGRTRCTGDFR